MIEWFRGGKPLRSINLDDRGVQYGDGLFETIAIRDRRPRLWDYHVERLQAGAERLGLPVPSRQALEKELESALEATNVEADRYTAKIVVTAGPGPRGYARPRTVMPTVLVAVSASAALHESLYRAGAIVRICNTRLGIQPQLAGIKSLNRLEQVLARREWQDESVFEGLLLDTDGRLICGTMSNVFLIDGNSLVTPAITRCGVAGVMRRHVLAVLSDNELGCDVRDIEHDELDSCDGMLLCNSQFGLLPVQQCGEKRLPRSEITADLVELIEASGIRERSS